MNRLPRVLLAGLVLAGATLIAGTALPNRAFACSCAPPRPIGAYIDTPELVVIAGEISGVHMSENSDRQVGTITITRVFKGAVRALSMSIIGGDGSDCGASLTGMSRVVMVASVDGGAIRALACAPHEDIGTPEGQQLLTEAVAAYGAGVVPNGDSLPVPGSDVVLVVALLIAVGIAGLMFIAIARRRVAS